MKNNINACRSITYFKKSISSNMEEITKCKNSNLVMMIMI